MKTTVQVQLTHMELINIKHALKKRVINMETYLAKSKDFKREPLIKRDIGVCRELVSKIDELIENGARTWSS